MILNALEGKSLPVYGDGRNIRDWLYVEDHCRAVWTVMTKGRRGETYNIGGRCEMRNLAVVEAVCDGLDDIRPLAGGRPRRELISFVKDRPGHDRRYAMDITKIRDRLEWSPRYNLEEGLAETVEWYLSNRTWWQRVLNEAYRAASELYIKREVKSAAGEA